jgi:4-hydroxyproline epimerase
VDHVELLGPARNGGSARNFVLCPGQSYDRSPCGTGTSAKLACLAAKGALREGEPWIQESIIGSHFHASFQWLNEERKAILPTISGSAFITAETTLILESEDPFRNGLPA